MPQSVVMGLDFGTESVRAILVDLKGNELATAVSRYAHGQILDKLPTSGQKLPPLFALQDPQDWIDSAAAASRQAVKAARIKPAQVVGIGVDFTSCTMLPALSDGTPLCKVPALAKQPYAWPKLWKHHGAQDQADRITALAKKRKEKWLARYGGTIGLEWFFPKICETLEKAPNIYKAAEVWVEGGDWYVWQLVGGAAATLPRSTCQAGYKAMWNSKTGYPSPQFFKALNPRMGDVLNKMPGKLLAPGEKAGELTPAMAKKMGLLPGVAVSAATIDAHAGVPGAGVAGAGTMVMVMGTSSCHMLNATKEKLVKGVAGIVDGGILPGLYGYETGQAAVGDAFDWLRRTLGQKDFKLMTQQAEKLAPGADGVLCIDWFNGCRTPLMDGELRGAFLGLSMGHTPGHMYRALLEASACGVRWIVELLQKGGVPVNALVATGGLPHHNPFMVQVYADVIGMNVLVHPSTQGPALGAAILGALAAGKQATGFSSAKAAIAAMSAKAAKGGRIVKPIARNRKAYDQVYKRYRDTAAWISKQHD